jgi:hypothetical protein
VAGSRAGNTAPSRLVRAPTCSAATTRRRASNCSHPTRSINAAGVDLYPRSVKNPRRSTTATASTVARSTRRVAPSHKVITDSNSWSAPDSTTPGQRVSGRHQIAVRTLERGLGHASILARHTDKTGPSGLSG